MTQIVRFVTSNYSAPQFQVTLDGQPYTVVVTFNFAAQRYYINIYNMVDGSLVCAVPIVGTPLGHVLNALEWDQNQQVVIATLAQPVYRPVGQIMQVTMVGCQPSTYNGTFNCMVISDLQFSYPMMIDPGPAVVIGTVSHYLDMIGPWFDSTMIFREMRFEVNP